MPTCVLREPFVCAPTEAVITADGGAKMLKNLRDPREAREAMLSLLPTSGTLAGIAVGLVGVMAAARGTTPSTIADDILLLSALGFLIVCYLIFFAIRTLGAAPARRMMAAIDVVFLGSMTAMVLAGFVVAYELF